MAFKFSRTTTVFQCRDYASIDRIQGALVEFADKNNGSRWQSWIDAWNEFKQGRS
jgi:hypothetical protein